MCFRATSLSYAFGSRFVMGGGSDNTLCVMIKSNIGRRELGVGLSRPSETLSTFSVPMMSLLL